MTTAVATVSAPDHARTILERQSCGRGGCTCQRSVREGHGLTHCVRHQDPGPSLSVSVKGGKVLVNCQANCAQDDVLAELRERGLWSERSEHRHGTAKSTAVTWYDYRDEQGGLLFQVGRKVPR